MNLLGVRIDDLTLEQARQKVRDFLASFGQFTIFTPNPEMLVKARKDAYFKDVLNKGDLNLCDGFGIWLMARFCSSEGDNCRAKIKNAQRIPGVDFMLEICAMAEEKGDSVYLLGSGSEDVARKTAENLRQKFPALKIAGFDKGPVFAERNVSAEADGGSESLEKINRVSPKILFVAFGMGKQEKWISENLSKMPSVKIAMGVGGAFDYISGNVKRAPCWMRKIGLEWMYRLVRQPGRFWRIFNATAVFSYLTISSKIKNKKQ